MENEPTANQEMTVLNPDSDAAGERLDKYISDICEDISRSYAAKLAENGNILCGGRKLLKNYKIKGGEEIIINLPEPVILKAEPENIPIDIIYEDNDVIVVNKPQGMVVHPAPGNPKGTLVNALMYHCGAGLSEINGCIRPGIVHRIDKDTSGLLVAAKNNEAHNFLTNQLKERKPTRRYYALVNGRIDGEGVIDKPIARSANDRKKMAVVYGGRKAVTHYKALENFRGYTLCECVLETGRTHQIRVHMASIGHSIVGDKTYGIKKEKFNLEGQLLHAKTIGFEHPRTGKYMEFSSELPEYFTEVLNKLRV